MLKQIAFLVALLWLPLATHAASWTESCPQMEVDSPFHYKRIWTPDDAWVKQPMPSNQVLLMSCGNWKVMGSNMVCYFGGYKTTYDYAVKKPVPDGATCQRAGQCQFKCSSQNVQQKMAPKLKVPSQMLQR